MRTLCDVCESAPAILFCAADEAALCRSCDDKAGEADRYRKLHTSLQNNDDNYDDGAYYFFIQFPGNKPASCEDLALQPADAVETRQEQNHRAKWAIGGNQQNHKIVTLPNPDVNINNHRRMDSNMIDLNARPQRVHEQTSNVQVIDVRVNSIKGAPPKNLMDKKFMIVNMHNSESQHFMSAREFSEA
ncbi:hypothetical protein ACLOJK_020868 [Asimina triloba]